MSGPLTAFGRSISETAFGMSILAMSARDFAIWSWAAFGSSMRVTSILVRSGRWISESARMICWRPISGRRSTDGRASLTVGSGMGPPPFGADSVQGYARVPTRQPVERARGHGARVTKPVTPEGTVQP